MSLRSGFSFWTRPTTVDYAIARYIGLGSNKILCLSHHSPCLQFSHEILLPFRLGLILYSPNFIPLHLGFIVSNSIYISSQVNLRRLKCDAVLSCALNTSLSMSDNYPSLLLPACYPVNKGTIFVIELVKC